MILENDGSNRDAPPFPCASLHAHNTFGECCCRKKGRTTKGVVLRFYKLGTFDLEATTLKYWRNQQECHSLDSSNLVKGSIYLRGLKVQAAIRKDSPLEDMYCIEIDAQSAEEGRLIRLYAPSAKERDEWVSALSTAAHLSLSAQSEDSSAPTFEGGTLLSPDQKAALWEWIPNRHRLRRALMAYSGLDHGYNLHIMYRQSQAVSQCYLARFDCPYWIKNLKDFAGIRHFTRQASCDSQSLSLAGRSKSRVQGRRQPFTRGAIDPRHQNRIVSPPPRPEALSSLTTSHHGVRSHHTVCSRVPRPHGQMHSRHAEILPFAFINSGELLGCFTSQPWAQSEHYAGSGECFVFRLTGKSR